MTKEINDFITNSLEVKEEFKTWRKQMYRKNRNLEI